jgi:hypothetical protein
VESANSRVHFEQFQRLAAPFPSRSLLSTPKARLRLAYEARAPGLSEFLKNNTGRQPAWQEIVDFS